MDVIVPNDVTRDCRPTGLLKKVRTQNDDQKTGVDIVRKALSWPARQIVINAGEDPSVTATSLQRRFKHDKAKPIY